MGVENNAICPFCRKEIPSEYFFLSCPKIKSFREQLQTAVNEMRKCLLIKFHESIVIWGHDANFRSDDVSDFIILQFSFNDHTTISDI